MSTDTALTGNYFIKPVLLTRNADIVPEIQLAT